MAKTRRGRDVGLDRLAGARYGSNNERSAFILMRAAAAAAASLRNGRVHARATALALVGSLSMLAACATQPTTYRASGGRVWDPKLGVWSSPKVVADGDAVPRGGGSYLTGRAYVIGGHTYVPSQNPTGYSAVGMASWYGDAFHGRRTANGEVFDKGSISAAHPTLPLPSYVRVTNLKNGHSMVVRVNDRGPYHGGRVMDVSQRVAEALAFRGEGTARVRIDYLGRASLNGSDDSRLMASLRTDGGPAQLDGMPSGAPMQTASDRESEPPSPDPAPDAVALGRPENVDSPEPFSNAAPSRSRRSVPLPPARPFTLGAVDTDGTRKPDRLAGLVARSSEPARFVPEDTSSTLLHQGPFREQARRRTISLAADQ